MRTRQRSVLALVFAVAICAGCNTVEGVGMDISASARTVGGWFGR